MHGRDASDAVRVPRGKWRLHALPMYLSADLSQGGRDAPPVACFIWVQRGPIVVSSTPHAGVIVDMMAKLSSDLRSHLRGLRIDSFEYEDTARSSRMHEILQDLVD